MAEIGGVLRDTREAQGLTLLDVERETRIRHRFLQALEEELFDDLPGDVYARGFIRNYALFLGLDPQPLIEQFDQLRSAPRLDEPDILDEPLTPQRASNVGARIFLIVMAVLALFLMGWYVYNNFYGGPSPSDLMRRLGIQVRPTSTPTRKPPPSTSLATPLPSDTPTLAPTLTMTPEITVTPTRTAFPTRTPTAISGILVDADVLEDTWLYVVVDGEVVLNELVGSGEHRTWHAENLFSVSIGNAAGISMTVNNVPLGVLGAEGEVVEINYTLDTLPTPAP